MLYAIADDSIKTIKEEKLKIINKDITINDTLEETYSSKNLPID